MRSKIIHQMVLCETRQKLIHSTLNINNKVYQLKSWVPGYYLNKIINHEKGCYLLFVLG